MKKPATSKRKPPAKAKPKPAIRADVDPLPGLWFLTFEDGETSHQGRIVARGGDGSLLIQYHEWLMGTPSTLALVPLGDLIAPLGDESRIKLFESGEDLSDWVEQHPNRRGGAEPTPAEEATPE